MTTKFDQYISAILEKCWKGYKQRGMKKKGKRIVPNCIEEGYFVTSEENQRKLKKALGNNITNVTINKYNSLTELDTRREYVQQILKDLKKEGFICFYRYPVEAETKLLIFDDVESIKRLLRKIPDALEGFVKY